MSYNIISFLGNIYPFLIDFGHCLCTETNIAVLPSFMYMSESAAQKILKSHQHVAPEAVLQSRVFENSDVFAVGDVMDRVGEITCNAAMQRLARKMKVRNHNKRIGWPEVQIKIDKIVQRYFS